MYILIRVGKEDRLLRNADNCLELCWKIKRRNKETGKMEQSWVARKFYRSIEQVFQALLNFKLYECDATTLVELRQNQIRIRKELSDILKT